MDYKTIHCKEYELQNSLNDWARSGYRFISLGAYVSGFNVYVVAVIGKQLS